jgi:ubiquitin carboxyl-terminal hydrolase L5
LIESDPGVFTELVHGMGVRGVQVEELYALDDDAFTDLQPLGLIFLFRWVPSEQDHVEPPNVLSDPPASIYFANQVIENACATQAVLSILLNCRDVNIGPALTDFVEFTRGFSPALKGVTLTNSELLRQVRYVGMGRDAIGA